MSPSADKPAKSNKVARKKNARKQNLFYAPNLELVTTLIASGLLLFIGRALTRYLDDGEIIVAQIYSALGLGLFVLAAIGFSQKQIPGRVSRPLQSAADWLDVSKAQVILLALSPMLAMAGWLAAGEGRLMRQPQLAVLLWLLGILLLVAGSWTHMPELGKRLRPTKEWAIVAAVFVGALLLRGVATAQFPWLLTGDEASGGLSALEFTNGERNNIFGLAWLSFPALYFYLQSLSIQLFGQTTEALRITSAVAGALTVVALYWFLKQAFGRWVALAGSILLAASHFHIHFSRIGLNNVWDGLFVAFISGAFWWGWTKNNRLGYVLAGLGFGLAQYFYASSRLLFLLFPIWLALSVIRDWEGVRARLNHLVIMALSTLVITLPWHDVLPGEYSRLLCSDVASVVLGRYATIRCNCYTGRLRSNYWPLNSSPPHLRLPAPTCVIGMFLRLPCCSRSLPRCS